MGASNFYETIYTKKSMQEAYEELCEDAVYMNGHSDANGTISTTSGVRPSPISSTPVREDEIDHDALSTCLERLVGGGHCEALPVKEVIPEYSRVLGVIEVEARMPSALFERGADYGERRAMTERVFLREVRKALKAGEALPMRNSYDLAANALTASDVSLPELSVRTITATPEARSQKVTTQATKGATETRYFVLKEGAQSMPRWESGFLSQAEARAHLPQRLADPSRATVERFEVISMTRRASGEPLVAHEVALGGRAKTVPVRLAGRLEERTRKAKVTGRRGWMFYGWARE